MSIQVVVVAAIEDVSISTRDEAGVFLEVPPHAEEYLTGDLGHESSEKNGPTREGEREAQLQKALPEAEEQNASLTSQVRVFGDEVERERVRHKELWRMNCQQLAEHDTAIGSSTQLLVGLSSRHSRPTH